MQTVVKHSGHLLRREAFRADQVRSPDVADEERVAGQDFLRLIRGLGVGDQNGDAFLRVAGSLQHAENDFADPELVAVLAGRVIHRRVRFTPEAYLSPRAFGKLAMAADEIGVQMRLDHISDLQPFGFGFVDVLLHVALRIDDRRFAPGADQIRSMRQTSQIKLLEVHKTPSLVKSEFPIFYRNEWNQSSEENGQD